MDISERGAATKGRSAKRIADADMVEVKATIPPRHVEAAMTQLGLVADPHEARFVYFFDTPDLDLLSQGITARARRRVGGKHDSTITFRPVEPDDVSQRWRRFAGFKIEADAIDGSVARSASLTMPVQRGLIKQVVAGAESVGRLFTEEQHSFLQSLTERRFDPETVVALGPIERFRWKFDDPALPWEVTAELWRRTDGQEIMELSVKAPAAQAAVVYSGFMTYLAEFGAERQDNQQARTRWALEYFAQQHLQSDVASTETSEEEGMAEAVAHR